jgi:hypothetical protein
MGNKREIDSEQEDSQAENWRDLAEQASKEQDPEALLATVRKLCQTLDRREPQITRRPPLPAQPKTSTLRSAPQQKTS